MEYDSRHEREMKVKFLPTILTIQFIKAYLHSNIWEYVSKGKIRKNDFKNFIEWKISFFSALYSLSYVMHSYSSCRIGLRKIYGLFSRKIRLCSYVERQIRKNWIELEQYIYLKHTNIHIFHLNKISISQKCV